MTLNSKVLSLVLLSGLTMGGTFAKKQKLNATDWTNESQTVKWSEDKCDTTCPDCTGTPPTSCPCPELKNCSLPLNFTGIASNVLAVISGSTGAQVVTCLNQSETVTKATMDLVFNCALNQVCIRIVACGSDAKNLVTLLIGNPTPSQTLQDSNWANLTLPAPTLDSTGLVATYNLAFTQSSWLKINADNVTTPPSASNNLSLAWAALADTAQFGLVLKDGNDVVVQGTVLPCSSDETEVFGLRR